MCFKKSENKKHKRISAETTAAVKDWILFFGDLVKASVEGVVEFWGPEKEETIVAESVILPETEETEPVEEMLDEAEPEVVEGVAEEVVETPEEISGPTAKELKQQVKALKRAQKLARKEEKRALKAEKKEQKLLRKQEKQDKTADKKEKKAVKKLAKDQKKGG